MASKPKYSLNEEWTYWNELFFIVITTDTTERKTGPI
jgi:hypothetical protein